MLNLRRPTFASCCLLLSLVCPACDDGMEDGPESGTETDGPAEIDEAAVQAMAADFASLTQVSDVPLGSQHGLADTVTFYVADDVLDLYLTIDPDDPSEVTFPEGALIVKENLDANGESAGFFAMYKGPEGYDPSGNDWYWLRVDEEGAVGDSGPVGFCKDCHGAGSAAVSDYVFGVPLDNRL
ncbi:MAG: hypothetical protein ACRBN8_16360 [Nannocystales bacterium]